MTMITLMKVFKCNRCGWNQESSYDLISHMRTTRGFFNKSCQGSALLHFHHREGGNLITHHCQSTTMTTITVTTKPILMLTMIKRRPKTRRRRWRWKRLPEWHPFPGWALTPCFLPFILYISSCLLGLYDIWYNYLLFAIYISSIADTLLPSFFPLTPLISFFYFTLLLPFLRFISFLIYDFLSLIHS